MECARLVGDARWWPFASRVEWEAARQGLSSIHEYFFHATPERNLPGIRARGIDPACEGPDSSYPCRIEPLAMRFATGEGVTSAISAARTRCQSFVEGIWQETDRPLLLRVPASSVLSASFLSASFGPDYSSSAVRARLPQSAKSAFLTSTVFLDVVAATGVLSCYRPILPELVEVTEDRLEVPIDLASLTFVTLTQ